MVLVPYRVTVTIITDFYPIYQTGAKKRKEPRTVAQLLLILD